MKKVTKKKQSKTKQFRITVKKKKQSPLFHDNTTGINSLEILAITHWRLIKINKCVEMLKRY